MNKVWDTDITYLISKGKRLCLSTIIDLYYRHLVSYKISKFNYLGIVISTLNDAIVKGKDVHRLIIYIDQGYQHKSHHYKVIFDFKGSKRDNYS